MRFAVWSVCMFTMYLVKLILCSLLRGQCSRRRLTGLGHFRFLARQQMHLDNPDDLDEDDDVDDGKYGKSVSNRIIFFEEERPAKIG